MLALKIIVVVVVVVLLVGTFLRVRKLRRDEMRELSKPVERRLMAPPPSPYEPSRGFRLLDESGQPLARPPLERPRLDPNRRYVFNELTGTGEESISSHPRHNDDWFLSRSSQRSTLSIFLRRLALLVVIALIVLVVAAYYAHHHSTKKPQASTTTSTSTTTTTTTFPSSFAATSTSGEDANYNVPAPTYQVVVRGLKGPTWAVFEMGPSNTLEWQGTVAVGKVEALTMTGNSRITLGSPSNASVHVKNSPVTFPSSLPATLVLVFTSTTPK
jgi:uncharacterized membrane protein